ncbi:MAG: DUF3052 domain-containing protein [Gemmatimonadales bacterium]
MAGYSPRSLVDKLGIKAGMRVAIIGAPPAFRSLLGQLPDGVTVATTARGALPFIHFFTKRRATLEAKLPMLLRALVPDGTLWVSWPKKASGVATDITEDVIRAVALPTGLVDVKVAAIDDVWSGLKLVRRLRHRGA